MTLLVPVLLATCAADFMQQLQRPQGPAGVDPTERGQWFDRLVPPSLRDSWRRKIGRDFPVTRTMLRATRPVLGRLQRLRGFLSKLQAKRCTTVLIAGGSVSQGHGVAGDAWWKAWKAWMDVRFPCGGSGHRFVVETGMGGSTTAFAAQVVRQQVQRNGGVVDMVIVEFAANDIDIGSAHAIGWHTERLVRRLLALRTPDAPAVLYLETDFRSTSWLQHVAAVQKMNSSLTANGDLHRLYVPSAHHPVLLYYGIPVVSTVDALLAMTVPRVDRFAYGSMHGRPNTSAEDKGYRYNHKRIHTDPCCHPGPGGHIFIALAMAQLITEELVWSSYPLTREETDDSATASSDAALRWHPIVMSERDLDQYVRTYELASRDLTRTEPAEGWGMAGNTGWVSKIDSRDKRGLIAEAPGAHVAFKLPLRDPQGSVSLTFLQSPSSVSAAVVWVSRSGAGECPSNPAEICSAWRCSCDDLPMVLASYHEMYCRLLGTSVDAATGVEGVSRRGCGTTGPGSAWGGDPRLLHPLSALAKEFTDKRKCRQVNTNVRKDADKLREYRARWRKGQTPFCGPAEFAAGNCSMPLLLDAQWPREVALLLGLASQSRLVTYAFGDFGMPIGGDRYLHLCLLPADWHMGPAAQTPAVGKFKLLYVSST